MSFLPQWVILLTFLHPGILLEFYGTNFSEALQKDLVQNHSRNDGLKLVHSTEQVLIFYDQSLQASTSWPFQFVTKLWHYILQNYGQFGEKLEIIFHYGFPSKCSVSTVLRRSSDDVNSTEITQASCKYIVWLNNVQSLKDEIIQTFANFTLTFKSRNQNQNQCWPTYNISEYKTLRILMYDFYMHTERSRGITFFNETVKEERLSILYWFRDWYYAIYSRHGGAAVLSNYLRVLRLNWDGVNCLNVGELIHFWSAAAGEDLTVFAIQTLALNWVEASQVDHAKVKYSNLHYAKTDFIPLSKFLRTVQNPTAENAMLVYYDTDVAFYLNSEGVVNESVIEPLKFLSHAWKYVKVKYGSFGPLPWLHVILVHDRKYKNSDRCYGYREQDIGAFTLYENRNCIFCDVPMNTGLVNIHKVLDQVGFAVLRNNSNPNFPPRDPFRSPMVDIVIYDILLHLEHHNSKQNSSIQLPSITSEQFKQKSWLRSYEFPRPGTFWFRDWYFPILQLSGRNENEVLAKYLHKRQADFYNEPSRRGKTMTVGEFVYFWSGVAAENLWHVASEAFGWSLLYHRQFMAAARKHPNFTNNIEFMMSEQIPIPMPVERLTENWIINKQHHTDDLNLVHVDGNVAVYFDYELENSITWPFELLSKGWQYAKRAYSSLRLEAILHIALHDSSNYEEGCSIDLVTNAWRNYTILDCNRLKFSQWKSEPDLLLFEMMEALSKSIVLGTNKMKPEKWLIFNPGWKIHEILTFDILMNIERKTEASKYLQLRLRHSYEIVHVTGTHMLGLRTWYYPLYVAHGYERILNKYLNYLYLYGPRITFVEGKKNVMNFGEFVHFWSGAAGVNLMPYLTSLGITLYLWESGFQKELTEARRRYPNVTYSESTIGKEKDVDTLTLKETWFGHTQFLLLAYEDSQLLIYYDIYVSRQIQWPLDLLRENLFWINNSYDVVREKEENGKPLYIVLHGSMIDSCNTVLEGRKLHRKIGSLIDCGEKSGWENKTGDKVDALFLQFASLVQQNANQSVGREVYYAPPMSQIIVLDLYLSAGMLEDAYRWLEKWIETSEEESTGDIFWIRDWYLPIYANYGGVSAIDKMLTLLANHRPSTGIGEGKVESNKLTVGEIVHFWSTAAQTSLLTHAQVVFGWTQLYEKQFVQAQQQLAHFVYECYTCGITEEGTTTGSYLITVFFAVFAIAMIFTMFLLYRRKVKRLQDQVRDLTPNELKEFFQGSSVILSSQDGESMSGNTSAESQPFDERMEIPRENLTIYFDQVLGSGVFGRVLRASLKLVNENNPGQSEFKTVAVKTVQTNVEVAQFMTLLSELKILIHLGVHENVAYLHGAVTTNIKNRELFIALEFCAKGDLLGHLQKHRQSFRDLFHLSVEIYEDTTKVGRKNGRSFMPAKRNNSCNQENQESLISTYNLLEWSRQISNGMMYVSSKKIIHGDLAARNILLTANNVAKISDFGLSRQLVNYSIYTKKTKTPLPWRWMAVESLRDMKFSLESDVWAFGVTLFEIFTLGTIPFAGFHWAREFIKHLEQGLRVDRPKYANEEICLVITKCMDAEPEKRITFTDILNKLERIQAKGDWGAEACSYTSML